MCPRSSTTAGSHTFTGEDIGTRYVALPLRILVNPNDPADLDAVHALQDAVTVQQDSPGSFEIPDWDPVSQKQVRDALIALALPPCPTPRACSAPRATVDPVRRPDRRGGGVGRQPREGRAVPQR